MNTSPRERGAQFSTFWRSTFLLCAILIFCACATGRAQNTLGDRFQNYSELAAAYQDGRDYQITAIDRHTDLLIAAIHGGTIEVGASQVARAVAQKDCSIYLFEGTLPTTHAFDLHITSTHFDEPTAVSFFDRVKRSVVFHGYWFMDEDQNTLPPTLLIGGLNQSLRQAVTVALQRFVETDMPSLRLIPGEEAYGGKFAGISPRNITNRPPEHGVQLEMSRSLRLALLDKPDLLNRFAEAIRLGISPIR